MSDREGVPALSERIRWLHLSDFRVGKDDYGQRRIFSEICSLVRDRIELRPDLVVVSGNIANSGTDSQYEVFGSEFLAELDSVLSSVPIFPVPGNHDVDRSKGELSLLATGELGHESNE